MMDDGCQFAGYDGVDEDQHIPTERLPADEVVFFEQFGHRQQPAAAPADGRE